MCQPCMCEPCIMESHAVSASKMFTLEIYHGPKFGATSISDKLNASSFLDFFSLLLIEGLTQTGNIFLTTPF